MKRCAWCPEDDALYIAYHDEEWGMPQRDGRILFEMLNLEGAQAGLDAVRRELEVATKVVVVDFQADLGCYDAMIDAVRQDAGQTTAPVEKEARHA